MTTPTGVLFQNPIVKPLSSNATFMSGCTATFYLTGTTTPASIYADGALTTPLANPLTADASGTFVAVYLDPSVIYRVQIKTSLGVLVSDTDPYVPFPSTAITAATVGKAIWPQTAAEIAASVTPSSYLYPEGDIRRYGALTSATDNSTAINNALLVSANGGAAAYIPPGTWKHTSTLNATLSCSMYGAGQNSILAPTVVRRNHLRSAVDVSGEPVLPRFPHHRHDDGLEQRNSGQLHRRLGQQNPRRLLRQPLHRKLREGHFAARCVVLHLHERFRV